eukprot:m.929456 g.929456  ORF g.929456 m.929456 type:complete len:135 (+) comp166314_c0_seq1:432-836(+)
MDAHSVVRNAPKTAQPVATNGFTALPTVADFSRVRIVTATATASRPSATRSRAAASKFRLARGLLSPRSPPRPASPTHDRQLFPSPRLLALAGEPGMKGCRLPQTQRINCGQNFERVQPTQVCDLDQVANSPRS